MLSFVLTVPVNFAPVADGAACSNVKIDMVINICDVVFHCGDVD
jgi:hypothetical protein